VISSSHRRRTVDERNSGASPEPIELTSSELDMVIGGRAMAFVKESVNARVSGGNDYTIGVISLALVTAAIAS
jgi:hypothetical protein